MEIHTVILLHAFNFPFINWKTKRMTNLNATADDK